MQCRIVMLLCLLLALGCNQVASRVFSAGLDANLGADLRDELVSGLHVLLCGAGGPLPDPKRSGPCVAVVAGDQVVIVDVGSGAARNLARMQLAPATVDAVLLTHFHSDHIDGLGELGTLRWVGAGHETPLPVHGPTGVTRVTTGFNDAYALDVGYRNAHHGDRVAPLQGAGLSPQPFEVPAEGEGSVVYDEGGLRITAFAVGHAPVSPAVGYRFDYAGRSAVVSGDTVKSSNLEAWSQGVDLLVHEALAAHMIAAVNEAVTRAGREVMAKITSDIPGYHATPVQAAEVAAAAGAGHLLFYHVVPALPLSMLEGLYLEGVSDVFDGPVTLGQDGTLISLPAGGTEIDAQTL